VRLLWPRTFLFIRLIGDAPLLLERSLASTASGAHASNTTNLALRQVRWHSAKAHARCAGDRYGRRYRTRKPRSRCVPRPSRINRLPERHISPFGGSRRG